MKYHILLAFFFTILLTPAFGQQANPSLIIEPIDIPHQEFNKVGRDATIVSLSEPHIISWQITIDNDLLYGNPDGNAVLRFYDVTIPEKFIELGMGSPPNYKYWVAIQLPDMGYVVVHDKTERGWPPQAKTILTYTERAGLTINNGARIVVSNIDIGSFGVNAYSVHGMEGSTDPPATTSGILSLEIISGDPTQNYLQLFPYILAAVIGIIVGTLFLTKKRS